MVLFLIVMEKVRCQVSILWVKNQKTDMTLGTYQSLLKPIKNNSWYSYIEDQSGKKSILKQILSWE